MPNLIQIKRSETTAVPSSLANGELAYSSSSNVLFIGMKDAVYAIAGGRSPGTLVANQAIVVNSSSLIDTIKVGNTTTNVISNNSGIFLSNSSSNTKLTIPTTTQYNGGDYWLNANGNWSQIPASVTTLDGLSDVTITSVGNNHLLMYDTISSQWINKSSGNGFVANSTSLNILAGNSQIVSNSSGIWLSSISAAQVTGDIALGTQTSGSYVATITAGAGLTGDGTGEGSTPTLAVGAANGITVAADAISVKAGNAIFTTTDGVNVLAGTGVVTNATGVHIGQAVGTTSSVTFQDLTINGNTALGSDTADRVSINGYVNTAIIPEANNTRDLGATGLRWNNIFGNIINANTISVATDVTVSGNLIVSGDLVTLNVSTLTVEDPLVELARLNPADSLDIGFFGLYVSSGNRYSGLFRDASDSGKYKLFTNLTVAPTTTVDTGNSSYTQATLVSYLETGALITNATHVAITANSTVNVTVTANTLTLSNPLVGTSGGTGLNSFTTEDILVANSSNGFRKLSKGTDGTVLQISGTSLVYSTLDGGTF